MRNEFYTLLDCLSRKRFAEKMKITSLDKVFDLYKIGLTRLTRELTDVRSFFSEK